MSVQKITCEIQKSKDIGMYAIRQVEGRNFIKKKRYITRDKNCSFVLFKKEIKNGENINK